MDLLPADKQASKQEELQKAVLELQINVQFSQQKIATERALQIEKLYRKSNQAIEAIAQQSGYDLVLQKEGQIKTQGANLQQIMGQLANRKVLYSSKAIDITEQVIVQMQHIPLLDFIASLSTVVILWLGGRLVIENALTIGELVAFTTYLGQLISPVRRLGMIIPAVAMASAAGERIYTILDAQSEVRDLPNAIELPPIKGQVRFENVSFSYFNQRQVLNKLNFEAEVGEVVALLGATGSGKSTIMNLIPRFYDVTGGRIRVDGYDLRDVSLNSLRDQIGIVLQETVLFAASIRENIAFGMDDVSEVDVIEAAKAAQAHDFIMAMPDGYETQVSERGMTLSGGQKQRIAIARALLKDPRIVLLDDASSSAHTETGRLIPLALERLMGGRTFFIIAQRLSTVRMADKVLVLQGGHVAAVGTHEELLQKSGLYAEIYYRHLR